MVTFPDTIEMILHGPAVNFGHRYTNMASPNIVWRCFHIQDNVRISTSLRSIRAFFVQESLLSKQEREMIDSEDPVVVKMICIILKDRYKKEIDETN